MVAFFLDLFKIVILSHLLLVYVYPRSSALIDDALLEQMRFIVINLLLSTFLELVWILLVFSAQHSSVLSTSH